MFADLWEMIQPCCVGGLLSKGTSDRFSFHIRSRKGSLGQSRSQLSHPLLCHVYSCTNLLIGTSITLSCPFASTLISKGALTSTTLRLHVALSSNPNRSKSIPCHCSTSLRTPFTAPLRHSSPTVHHPNSSDLVSASSSALQA